MPKNYFQIPRNLPHAATIAQRIENRIFALELPKRAETTQMVEDVAMLSAALSRYRGRNDPPDQEANAAVIEAAEIARRIVDSVQRSGIGEDRLGQLIRNLFECLGLGQEGAELSLRAGENPDSLMRP